MKIRKLLQAEKANAMRLVWDVFLEFEAPNYSKEGIQTFRDFIENKETINALEVYGAYEKENLLGMIATREDESHIALFFVKGSYQRKGIGRKLVEVVLKNSNSKEITVNFSLFATKVYQKLGFKEVDIEQTTKGMRYIPMKYNK